MICARRYADLAYVSASKASVSVVLSVVFTFVLCPSAKHYVAHGDHRHTCAA